MRVYGTSRDAAVSMLRLFGLFFVYFLWLLYLAVEGSGWFLPGIIFSPIAFLFLLQHIFLNAVFCMTKVPLFDADNLGVLDRRVCAERVAWKDIKYIKFVRRYGKGSESYIVLNLGIPGGYLPSVRLHALPMLLMAKKLYIFLRECDFERDSGKEIYDGFCRHVILAGGECHPYRTCFK